MEPIVAIFTVIFVSLVVVFLVRLVLDRKHLKSFRGVAFNREVIETLGQVAVDTGDGIPTRLIVHRLAGDGDGSCKIGLETHGSRFRKRYFHMTALDQEEALKIADLLERSSGQWNTSFIR